MLEGLIFIVGVAIGAGVVWSILSARSRRVDELKAYAARQADHTRKLMSEAKQRADQAIQIETDLRSREEKLSKLLEHFRAQREEFESRKVSYQQLQADNARILREMHDRAEQTARAERDLREREERLARLQGQVKADCESFEARKISYQELKTENVILKTDLQNMEIARRKLAMDQGDLAQRQKELDERAEELAGRYLKDTVKWISQSLTPANYTACRDRLVDAIRRCRDINVAIPPKEEEQYIATLKAEYELMVRAAIEREEQARIKARIREEEQLKREVDRELKQLDRERAAIAAALEKAIADVKGAHGEEIERLKARLAEAEQKAERAKSQAEMTRSGNVYVISNIGSFGEGVFKIGMTRRLEPLDRVRELGDASVPFQFDVHMMIACEDAPALENALHRELHRARINKVNPRKEFFKTDLEAIRKVVEENHGEVQYVADAEALEYRQSLTMTDQDAEYIESVYEKFSDDEKGDGE